VERNILGSSAVDRLRRAGAVGELLGRFFDARGRECGTPFRNRVVSLALEDLKRIPRRVGVLAGADRAEAVLAAIRGGLLNALALGEEGATALLARAQGGRSRPKKASSVS
jgi:DNA-binding transcriptional regulator LsrR (DeoR family)